MFRLKKAALIAEIIGGAAVVISLIFVGVQLAQSNELAREAAEQKQIESIGELSRMVAENPRIAELMVRANAGEQLTQPEQAEVTSMITFGQRTWEALYYQYKAGRVSPELWEAHRHQARAMQNTLLGQAVWRERKRWFSKSYQEFRDSDGVDQTADPWTYNISPSADAPEPAAPQPATPQQ